MMIFLSLSKLFFSANHSIAQIIRLRQRRRRVLKGDFIIQFF